jgi:phage recombination protein Bet
MKMNELTVRNNQVAVREQVTRETVKNFLFGSGTKLNNQQIAMFEQICMINQLNPFNREIYAVAYGSNFNIITGYEVYLKRASESGLLDGWDCKTEGEGKNLKAVCTIYRKDWNRSFVHEVLFSEYNTGKSLWQGKPITMIKKVAIAQAFRLAFPNEVGGLPYTSDEIDTEYKAELKSEEKQTVTKTATVKKSSAVQKESEIEVVAEPIETINKDQQKLLFATLKDLKLTPDDLKFYVNANLHLESTADIPANKIDSILDGLKLMAENKGGENE